MGAYKLCEVAPAKAEAAEDLKETVAELKAPPAASPEMVRLAAGLLHSSVGRT